MTDTTMTLARLPRDRDTRFEITPDSDQRAGIARKLDLQAVRKLRFTGALSPDGKRDWHLDAMLGATVVQTCVVTLAPVVTRIDAPVQRRYSSDVAHVAPQEEMEMPEDDSLEPLPAAIDLMEVLTEALALALPPYPRADGAALGSAVYAPPGVAPMQDEDAKPLAGLAALKDKLKGPSDPES